MGGGAKVRPFPLTLLVVLTTVLHYLSELCIHPLSRLASNIDPWCMQHGRISCRNQSHKE